MSYAVHEIYYTLQGEGAQAGRAAVFLRFSGCNLWSGREQDRHRGPGGCSRWCDTTFVGSPGQAGGRYPDAYTLADAVSQCWPKAQKRRLVVCTGGEPLLQLDAVLVDALHQAGFEVAVETNGTLQPPPNIDWLTVSPKAGSILAITQGNELKLVYPQVESNMQPEMFAALEFEHFYLQPLDDAQQSNNIQAAAEYCMQNPQWQLSIQMHKILGLP